MLQRRRVVPGRAPFVLFGAHRRPWAACPVLSRLVDLLGAFSAVLSNEATRATIIDILASAPRSPFRGNADAASAFVKGIDTSTAGSRGPAAAGPSRVLEGAVAALKKEDKETAKKRSATAIADVFGAGEGFKKPMRRFRQ